ncbi:MAG TPA: hypothetical protein VGP72_21250 [Planctomycetota bacterium]
MAFAVVRYSRDTGPALVPRIVFDRWPAMIVNPRVASSSGPPTLCRRRLMMPFEPADGSSATTW